MTDKETAAALEALRCSELQLQASREYRIGLKICRAIQDLRHLHFGRMLSREIRCRRMARYSVRTAVGEQDYIYGDYPQDSQKFVVYTCITGGYDHIQEPLYTSPCIDYVLLTDNDRLASKHWRICPIPQQTAGMNPILVNRYVKFHPAELFPQYDYAVYVDGNIQVLSDVRNMVNRLHDSTGLALHRHDSRDCLYKEVQVCKMVKRGNPEKLTAQMEKYRQEGMPEHFGMYEANIILSDLHNPESQKLLSAWWEEFLASESMRDQVALPYVIWKSGHRCEEVGFLGGSMFRNPKFKKVEHS